MTWKPSLVSRWSGCLNRGFRARLRVRRRVLGLSSYSRAAAASRTHGGPAIVSGSGVVQRQPTPAGRRVDVIEVVFRRRWCRVLSPSHPGDPPERRFSPVLPVAGLWQPFHDRAFAIYNQIASSTRAGERVGVARVGLVRSDGFSWAGNGRYPGVRAESAAARDHGHRHSDAARQLAGRSADRLGLAEVADLIVHVRPRRPRQTISAASTGRSVPAEHTDLRYRQHRQGRVHGGGNARRRPPELRTASGRAARPRGGTPHPEHGGAR